MRARQSQSSLARRRYKPTQRYPSAFCRRNGSRHGRMRMEDGKTKDYLRRTRRTHLRSSDATSTTIASPRHSAHAPADSGIVPNAVLRNGT